MTATDSGRAPSGQALVASDEARSDLHPPGFDPSRVQLGCCENELADVAERWKRQYCRDGRWGGYMHDAKETHEKLLATKTVEDLDAIGLRNWVTERCDLCHSEPEQWLMVGEEPDYEARWLYLCLPCAEHVGAIAMETRRAETGTGSVAKP